jgi:hypothetical protein
VVEQADEGRVESVRMNAGPHLPAPHFLDVASSVGHLHRPGDGMDDTTRRKIERAEEEEKAVLARMRLLIRGGKS